MQKTVLLGISGGIAASRIPELISHLQKNDLCVIALMTYGATKILAPEIVERLTGNPVYTDIFSREIVSEQILKNRKIDHIELAKKADVMVIAPATANIIAKIAAGIADDYVTTTILAARSPVLICPSMNSSMWKHPATQYNIRRLHAMGYIIIDPVSGMLACGDEGIGRLADVEQLSEEVLKLLHTKKSGKGKKILITAGGTREPIDTIRSITNNSSGKMGIAIADAAYLAGADVFLVRSIRSVTPQYPIPEKTFDTVEDLDSLLMEKVPESSLCIHAAAVSDFSVEKKIEGKISSGTAFDVTLIPQGKLLSKIKQYNPNVYLAAFKAEWGVSDAVLIHTAKEKLRESRADMIVANDVSRKDQGFSSDCNAVILIDKGGEITHIPFQSKTLIGKIIIENILSKM